MKTSLSIRHLFLVLALLVSCGGWQQFANAESAGSQEAAVSASVNVNTASAGEISSALNGVGEKRAEAIVAYREAHGKFSSLEDLMNVKGIGEKVLEKNAGKITF